MRIGILECGPTHPEVAATLGTYPQMFTRLFGGRGWDFTVWSVKDMDFPAGPEAADGWILTGSRHGVYEDHGFIPPLEAFIRDAYAAAVPMVGICFGHQIIAQALGGKVVKHPAGWAVGPQDYDFDGERITLNAWHQDQVTQLPPDAEVAATNAFCENAALVYGDRAYTVQAHPEFDDGFVDGLIEHRARGVVPAELLDAARARMGRPLQSRSIADRIETFFKAAPARQNQQLTQNREGAA